VAAILGTDEVDHPFVQSLEESGVDVHPLRWHPRSYWNDWLRVCRLCRHLDPHVVHSHSVRTDVVAAKAAARSGFATMTTVHGASFQGGRSSVYEWLQKRSYRSFDAVIAVSQALRAQLVEEKLAPPDRVRLIANACCCWGEALPRREARSLLGLPPEAFVIGWAARMIPVKGGDVFLAALARLGVSSAHAALIGDGPSRAALELQARSLPMRDRVHFLGGRDHAGRLLSAFDLFVSSSRSEGMPIAIFEAVAAGVPIVASRVGGIPEMLGDREALLVPPEDPVALAAAIESAQKSYPDSRARAARAAEGVRERYAAEPWLDEYERTYREILGAGRS
jgi:glycosyltransferase involved in cell wall biosynthesis